MIVYFHLSPALLNNLAVFTAPQGQASGKTGDINEAVMVKFSDDSQFEFLNVVIEINLRKKRLHIII